MSLRARLLAGKRRQPVTPADVEQMPTNREHRAERRRSGATLLWVVLGEEAPAARSVAASSSAGSYSGCGS